MRLSSRGVQGLLWLMLAALAGVMAWAGAQQGMGAGWAVISSSPWGWATLADLYGGLALVALLVLATARSPGVALLWCVAIALLGNLATLLYVILWLRRGAPGIARRRPGSAACTE